MLQAIRPSFLGLFNTTKHATAQRSTIRTFHKDYDAAREEQSLKLSDGRTIGFAEYGDLQGKPLFCFHGSPGSRYDGCGLIDIAKKLNIHIICPDRPGHGLSTYQAERKLGDYPHDISQLAKHLGLSKYSVFGQSGGGPYAIACAYASPKDELLNAAVIAGIGPPAVLTVKDAGLYTVAMLQMQKWMPGLMRMAINWTFANDTRLQNQLTYLSKFMSEEDGARLSTPEAQSIIMTCLKEAYAQGPDGVLKDAQVCSEPWDFELKDVHRKVQLYYGRKDNRTPVAFGRYYKEHLPQAELTEFEGASHFNFEDYDDEIMPKIVGIENQESALQSEVRK